MDVNSHLYGVVDINSGKSIVAPKYKTLGYFKCGLAKVSDEYGIGYIDTSGKEIIPVGKYKAGEDFIMGYAAVQNRKNKYGLINTLSKIIIPFRYDKIEINENTLPYAYCTESDEEKKIDIRKCREETVLDGLYYHKSYKTIQL